MKGRSWRIHPRSSFGGPGISKIIAVFCQGSTAGKDLSEEIAVRGIYPKNLFGLFLGDNLQRLK